MPAISVEEAKQNLQAILEKVTKGEEVTIVQEGKVVARVVPPLSKEEWLARHKVFRNSINVKGEPLSATVIRLREEARY
ncbi:type II toxin-antitoxin system prevent-host-death family antitoxin [Microcoleus sp. A2-C5]|uniref:type II toxin-antitoxin system Phd/YefM family antitoxin n=1 Tax=Microcoleaceae TaxID=1892252 RepID=UPI002238BD7F|nr:type II toxin-antitoxin system prevent-host-death family antitoxin [Lyngbya sp. CCAP 1446/10]MCW6052746.1 type II toxin-antitoxin system prevent-host-death family antitoxin [Lyngbya sp. CCAP 1446/10]